MSIFLYRIVLASLMRKTLGVLVAAAALLTGCGDRPIVSGGHYVNAETNPAPSSRVSYTALDLLEELGVPRSASMAYDDRFYREINGLEEKAFFVTLADLYKAGARPAVMNAYDERFSFNDIVGFWNNGNTPDVVNEFHPKLSPANVKEILHHGGNSVLANVLCEKGKGLKPTFFTIYDTVPEAVTAAFRVGHAEAIAEYECGLFDAMAANYDILKPEVFNKYSPRLSSEERLKLWEDKILPETANKYTHLELRYNSYDAKHVHIDAEDIAFWVRRKISPEAVEKIITDKKEQALSLCKSMFGTDGEVQVEEKKIIVTLKESLPPEISKEIAKKWAEVLKVDTVEFVSKKQEKKPTQNQPSE